MRKTIRHIALLALTAVFLTGQTATAFADDNYGPGMLIGNPQPENPNTDTNNTTDVSGGQTDSQSQSDAQTVDPIEGGGASQTEETEAVSDPNIQTTPTREITEDTPLSSISVSAPRHDLE